MSQIHEINDVMLAAATAATAIIIRMAPSRRIRYDPSEAESLINENMKFAI